MKKRLKKKRFKKKYGVCPEAVAEEAMRAFGQALGRAQADYMEKLLKEQ